MLRTAWSMAIALGACTQASPPEQPRVDEVKAEVQGNPLAAAWTEPARTHLLLAAHTSTAKTARFVGVHIDKRELSAPVEVDALPRAGWPDHFVAVAAHGGTTRFVTQRPAADGAEAIAFDLGDPSSAVALALPEQADAMHVAGQTVLVGIDNTLHWFDLGQAEPKLELLLARSLPAGKAYDLFVRDGGWLFAIDDEVQPIYADTFRLHPGKAPVHEHALQLPGMINGHYFGGVLAASGSDAGTLYVLGSYGVMDGNGQDLAALPVIGGKTKHDGELVLNSTALTDPAVLEEHVERGTGQPRRLLAGTAFTPWAGVELVGKGGTHLLLPAGDRGLLAVAATFGPDSNAEVVFAEPTRDVEVIGDDRIFVLTDKQLVELAWSLPKPKEVARVDLPEAFDRIVD